MTQETYESLRDDFMPVRVKDAAVQDLARCYRKLWDSCRIENPEVGASQSVFDVLPEPADGVAFQCFINLPPKVFCKLLQGAIGVEPDGVLGPVTFRAISKLRGDELSDKILDRQEAHYEETAQLCFLRGLRNRVSRVRVWTVGKSPLN